MAWRRHAEHYRAVLRDLPSPRVGGSPESFEAERGQIDLAHERVLTVSGLDDGALAHDYYSTLLEWRLTLGPRSMLDVGLGPALRHSHRLGGPVHGALLLDAAATAYELRKYRRARAFCRSGMRAYERWPDPGYDDLRAVEAARGHRLLGAIEHVLGNDKTAEEHYRTSLALAEGMGAEEEIGQLLGNWAVLLQDQGRDAEAYAHYVRALAIAERRDDLAHAARWTGNCANALRELGRLDEAIAMAERGLRLAEMIGDRTLQANRRQSLSELAARTGDARGAVEHQHQAAALARAHLDDRARAIQIGNLAVRQADAGDPEAAIASAEEAIRLNESIGDQERASAGRQLRDHLRQTGHRETMMAAIAEADRSARAGSIGPAVDRLRTLADQCTDGELAAYCLGYLGHWQFVAGDVHAALKSYNAAITHDEPDSALLLNHRANRASVLRKTGDTTAAAHDFQTAIDLSRRIHNDRGLEGIAYYNLAQMAADEGRENEARELYTEALAAFTELGAVEARLVADALQRLGKPAR